mmetsp:Transcript_31052/g.68938  ORF Transcript_31052/g.68938 Transcript_31052/m.68938 type:complete len:555 (+) Transcript_31052:198-1862(+)|eukprot:CAMPEP_0202892784 /NCGR_PEP_ID=MMETSP1392-20130828/2483_1 /ASSEMBLY_ACC=CAM_ASM_000868 /TAXON_ID=225041 /ORGANISM="Chlamydomonas chlamydogama, Strain SAG 11-48b" /LENGTH=554 /DNA_ID=CAMNT_0049576871 /DNA_START=154 /DNA_END=1818 /DNA_ORIENTATION=-
MTLMAMWSQSGRLGYSYLLLLGVLATFAQHYASAADVNIAVCENATWRKLIFTKTPVDPSYFTNPPVKNWDTDRALDYVKNQLLKRSAASLAFLAMALVILFVLILWRIFRCCCVCCCCVESCKAKRDAENPHGLVRGCAVWTIKIFIILLGVGACVAAVVGMVSMSKTLDEEGWTVVAKFSDYAYKVINSMNGLLGEVQQVPAKVDKLVLDATGTPLYNGIRFGTAPVKTSAQDVVQTMQPNVNNLQKDVVDKINEFSNDWKGQSDKYNNYRVYAAQGTLGAGILLMFLLLIFSLVHCPCAMVWTAIFTLFLIVFYFLMAAVLAMALVGMTDGCGDTETILISLAPTQFAPMVQYYLSPTTPTSDLEAVLKQADVIDIPKITAQINAPMYNVTATFTSQVKQLPPPYNVTLAADLATLNASALAIAGAIGASSPPTGVLGEASYSKVNPLYLEVKSYGCCNVADEVAVLWSALTAEGWLLMIMVAFVMILLGRLDRIPQSGCCCACSCLLPTKVEPKVAPMPDKTMMAGAPPTQQMYYPPQQPYYPPPQAMTL